MDFLKSHSLGLEGRPNSLSSRRRLWLFSLATVQVTDGRNHVHHDRARGRAWGR